MRTNAFLQAVASTLAATGVIQLWHHNWFLSLTNFMVSWSLFHMVQRDIGKACLGKSVPCCKE